MTSYHSTSGTNANEEPLLDAEVLRGLKDLGGDDDPGLFLELIDMFLQDAPQRMDEIHRGLAERDMRLLERAAHTLKSASANVGAMSLSSVCRRMEESVRRHEDARVPALVEETKQLWPRVEAALRAARS